VPANNIGTVAGEVTLPDRSGEPRSATENHELSHDERAELERLRAETAELRSQGGGQARRRRPGWRAPVAIVLIVLG
jgi:hypothetical protein